MKRLFVVALMALAACSAPTEPVKVDTTKPKVDTPVVVVKKVVKIIPPAEQLRTGIVALFKATIETVAGGANADATEPAVTWASSNPERATINSAGQLKVYAPGPVTLTASSEGATAGTLMLNAILDSLPIREYLQAVTFNSGDTVNVGVTVKAVPVLKDVTGATVGLAEKYITWGTTHPHVATVDDSGNVTTHGAGVACITAIINGMARCRNIRVLGATNAIAIPTVTITGPVDTMFVGDTTRSLSAAYKDAQGVTQVGAVSWGAHAELTIKINALGQIRALRKGQSTISAVVNGVAKQFMVYAKE
jgi:hypothetical protein